MDKEAKRAVRYTLPLQAVKTIRMWAAQDDITPSEVIQHLVTLGEQVAGKTVEPQASPWSSGAKGTGRQGDEKAERPSEPHAAKGTKGRTAKQTEETEQTKVTDRQGKPPRPGLVKEVPAEMPAVPGPQAGTDTGAAMPGTATGPASTATTSAEPGQPAPSPAALRVEEFVQRWKGRTPQADFNDWIHAFEQYKKAEMAEGEHAALWGAFEKLSPILQQSTSGNNSQGA